MTDRKPQRDNPLDPQRRLDDTPLTTYTVRNLSLRSLVTIGDYLTWCRNHPSQADLAVTETDRELLAAFRKDVIEDAEIVPPDDQPEKNDMVRDMAAALGELRGRILGKAEGRYRTISTNDAQDLVAVIDKALGRMEIKKEGSSGGFEF